MEQLVRNTFKGAIFGGLFGCIFGLLIQGLFLVIYIFASLVAHLLEMRTLEESFDYNNNANLAAIHKIYPRFTEAGLVFGSMIAIVYWTFQK